jgi:hypothetical protein
MKKTITFTISEEIIDELKEIREETQLNLSATAEKLFIKWLSERE